MVFINSINLGIYISEPTIMAIIAENNTAPLAISLDALARGCIDGIAISIAFSIEVLIISAVITRPITKKTILSSIKLKSITIPSITTRIATIV